MSGSSGLVSGAVSVRASKGSSGAGLRTSNSFSRSRRQTKQRPVRHCAETGSHWMVLELPWGVDGCAICTPKQQDPTGCRVLGTCGEENQASPSERLCSVQHGGRSVICVTVIPRGSRPSIAASTMSGASRARLVVDLALRSESPFRFARLWVVWCASVISASSQTRR